MPSPAPLPSLREALDRRRALFGPVDLDEPPAAPRGVLARCAAALRDVADLLELRALREAGDAPGLTRS